MRVNVNVCIPDGITCTGCPYYHVDASCTIIRRSCRLLNKSDSGYTIPTVKFDKCKKLKDGDLLMLEDTVHKLSLRFDGKVL